MKAVNLIPAEQRRAQASGKGAGGAYVVVGVLAVLLAMAVAFAMTQNKLNASQTKATEAKQEADALEARAAQLGSFTNFASIKDQRLASVAGAAATRFDWERLMREVSLVMPEGSWLQTAQASVLGDPSAEAAAASAPAAAGPASPSANFVGCTRQQSEVATLMVRLRQMHRVTDVKLNESAREQGSTEASVDSCGRLFKFDVTVSFEPAAPVKEAPRGAVRVPASLGGGS
jgi:Tfp pilus assembly protein PilN